MTNTIPNVPRELKPCPFCGDIPSENSHALTDGGFKYGAIQCGCGALGPDVRTEYKDWPHWRDAAFAAWNERALLSAPSPAGVDGLEVVAWVTTGFSGKSRTRRAFTVNADDAARQHTNWTPHYRQVNTDQLCRLSDAKAIIDGLRGEVERLQFSLEVAKTDELSAAVYAETESIKHSLWNAEKECDQHAKRIGELEGLLQDSAELIKHGVFEDGICCCGASVDSHGFGDGHSPVDALAYHAGQVCERIDAALSSGKEGE